MKRIWIVLGVVTAVILVHGTYTFRVNHQNAFAQAVEKRIDIVSIHVIAKSGTLILRGHASKQQAEYAEEIARMFIAKYAKRAINPPSAVKNEIEVGGVVTTRTVRKSAAPKAATRAASKARQIAMGGTQAKSRR